MPYLFKPGISGQLIGPGKLFWVAESKEKAQMLAKHTYNKSIIFGETWSSACLKDMATHAFASGDFLGAECWHWKPKVLNVDQDEF
jgi:hypothetical protein